MIERKKAGLRLAAIRAGCIIGIFYVSAGFALNATDTIQGEAFSGQSGVETEACSEGGQDVTSIQNGDYVYFQNLDFGAGQVQCFEARVAGYGGGGYIEVRLDSLAGALAGTCEIQPETGGWQTWTVKACNVTGAVGLRTVYLKFTGGGGDLFNLNWFKFHGTAAFTSAGWRQSTASGKGAWKGALPLSAAAGSPVIEIFPDIQFQRVFGWGGAFNDNGAATIDSLDAPARSTVMRELFDPFSGCRFSVGRVPIGISDFSLVPNYYSLDETSGDYSMTKFSIAHDLAYNIPFCKEAMKWQPNLMLYGSPWTPPTWMKSNTSWQGPAHINQNAQTFTAYATYFRKFVQAWKKEGLALFVVFPQNEPGWNVAGQPACGWTGTQLRDFVRDYLYPDFNANGVATQIWMGTFHVPDFANDLKPSLDDTAARKMIRGCGCQREAAGAMLSAMTCDTSLHWHAMETETMCWSGANSWSDAMSTFQFICGFEEANTNYYNFWNMILNSNTNFGWMSRAQNSMITINTATRKVTYNPEFFIMKHFSYYIRVGAIRVGITNADTSLRAVAFKNPDGTVILEVQNKSNGAISPLIKVGAQAFTPALPASSVNTFAIGGIEAHESDWKPGSVPSRSLRETPMVSARMPGIFGVYDLTGRLIRRFTPEMMKSGSPGDVARAAGGKAARGLYIVKYNDGKIIRLENIARKFYITR
jgi:glucosylceramidase